MLRVQATRFALACHSKLGTLPLDSHDHRDMRALREQAMRIVLAQRQLWTSKPFIAETVD